MLGDNLSKRSSANDEELLASFAHEINNPLESLFNILYLVESELPVTKEGRHLLSLARDEARRISVIARSAMNNLRGSPDYHATNVPELLGSVLEFYRSRFDAKGIALTTRYCDDHVVAIESAPLRQVFSSLLMNAADAVPRGGRVHVRVALAQEWSGLNRHGLRVTFADNGCGIAADDLPKVTLPFFTTKGAGGTGIGLSLVNAAIKKFGGGLHIRSCTTVGRSGSVFSVFLPAA